MSHADYNPDDRGDVIACLDETDVLVYEDLGEDDEPTVRIPCASAEDAAQVLAAIRAYSKATVL